jgi:polyisoprenoid-binding protein YceI
MEKLSKTVLLLLAAQLSVGSLAQSGPCVVPGLGYFRIHVGTGGLFGVFAHDHLIEAEKIEGCAVLDPQDLTHSSIKLTFPSASLRVLDPKESAKDRASVQQNMETQVLRIAEFPSVVFESTSIERRGSGAQLDVHGNLTIRDKTQAIVLPLTFSPQTDGTYRVAGKYNFKQTSFGIKPIQLAGGTIKVKDELQTEFEIFLKN